MEANKSRFLIWAGVILLLLILIVVAALYFFDGFGRNVNPFTGADDDDTTNPPLVDGQNSGSSTTYTDIEDGDDEGEPDFTVNLSDGNAGSQETTPLTVAATSPLNAEEIAAILARLPEIESEVGDQQDFNLPGDPIPPPQPGTIIDQPFPVEDTLLQTGNMESGPLEVLRYAPEGDVSIAPTINITFNQPMVPLSTLEQLSEADVPVDVTPDIPGVWSWVGTRTLRFNFTSDEIDRLPMATEYTVNIPAGTVSASGSVLEEAVTWTFSTPPLQLVTGYPRYDPQPLEPLIFLSFDQRIDQNVILAKLSATADNSPVSLMLASEEDYAEDKDITRLVENAAEGRWIVVKPVEPLPTDAYVVVTIPAGTSSAEGPLLTKEDQSFDFNTYAPLKIEEYDCSWYSNNDKCYPLSPWYIRFNNPIDPEQYDESMISIDPALPGASINIHGNTISISGASEGSTNYRVTVDGSLTDIFGQQLGRNEKLTFKVGTAQPMLHGPDNIFITLDPAQENPALSIYTINYDKLDVQIYQVEPSDWPAFKTYLQEYERSDEPSSPPGQLVLDDTLKIDYEKDTLTEVNIDISQVMDGEFGHYIVVAKPVVGFFEEDNYWEHINVWVQITDIGLDAFADQDDMTIWATDLNSGAPLEGVSVASDSGVIEVQTNNQGTATFTILDSIEYLTAQKGEDFAFLPHSQYFWGDDAWRRQDMQDNLLWYVFDDRAMYRPGEEVHIKGWLRRLETSKDGDLELVGNTVDRINVQVFGPQGNQINIDLTEIELTGLGGFDLSFTIPENVNLGYAEVNLSVTGSITDVSNYRYTHSFQIQEFRTPEFEVSARNETTGPYFVDDEATVAVEAAYYAGGPLPNAEVYWSVNSSPTNYTPPNWSGFSFGVWTPWWYDYYNGGYDSGGSYETFSANTDATGTHYLNMTFANSGQPRPYSVTANASVTDVNRQAWASTTSLLVHPADLYVGLRTERYFVNKGIPIDVELIATDLDGNAIANTPITVTASRMEWKIQDGDWQQVEVDRQECIVTSEAEPVTCTFETPLGGRYKITATVTDELGRENQSSITRWVSGGQQPTSFEVEQETATLIPDKETYQPGDTAEILVMSPFSPAEGLLTVSRSGVLYTERFVIEEDTTTLLIPITEEHLPNLNIQVDLVGSAPRTDALGNPVEGVGDRPAYATGTLNLQIPPLVRTLDMTVTPQETALEPGGETTLDIVLKDADGRPVEDAELAVVVVDEAILALTNYQLTDPLTVFYYNRSSNLSSTYGRSSIVLVDPASLLSATQDAAARAPQATNLAGAAYDDMADGMVMEEMEMDMAMEAPTADMDKATESGGEAGGEAGADAGGAIAVRTDFNPLAVFSPEVRTDADGTAQVQVNLPDNLTRYRIMVVAVDSSGQKFGSAESSLTARLPLMVRPSVSRFLNFGDQFELPLVVQNQTDEDMTVNLVAQASNLDLTGDIGVQVTVPANDRVEVRFPGTTDMAGTARIQFAGVSGSWADAAEVSLPVYTPATTEAFATYGVIDDGATAQPLARPEDVIPGYGGLEITTSSTALQALTDAVLYLVSYPYDCSEQMASRILAIASLRDVLTAFEAEDMPTPAEMEASVVADIEMLSKLQNYDGGFPYWRKGKDSIPFNTVHVALSLQRARTMGYEVPEDMWQGALNYLRYIEDYYPYWYSQRTRQTISAYALYVRLEMDDPDPNKAADLLRDAGVEELSLDALAWIWQVLTRYDDNYADELNAIRTHVNNQAVETAGAANFTTGYGDDDYVLLHSNRRTDALLLDAMISDSPDSDLIPKVVTGLLAHRTKGRWSNTQENVFVLMALDRYFETYENVEPDFVARMWLGEDYIGSSQFEGYTTDTYQLDVPMSYLLDNIDAEENQDIMLQKDGDGRLYYRLGLRYAPDDLQLDALDMGFVVQRTYEGIDDPEDVWQDADGIWHIKAGARVRVRVTMVADNRRYHVALVDPLPAGLEIINPALAVSEDVPSDPNSTNTRWYWWWWTWYEHQNMRDERVEAFTSLLWDGVYEYTYETRATMPGTFVVPPAKAEEMYSPEVFGRSSSDIVVIED